MQLHLLQQLVGRCGHLCVIRDGFAYSSPSIASTLHASEVAHHLREPSSHWPTGVGLAAPRRNPRLLDEIVGVVSIVRERGRKAPQPCGILQELFRSWLSGHAPILSPLAKA
jgi:hypothetical protein